MPSEHKNSIDTILAEYTTKVNKRGATRNHAAHKLGYLIALLIGTAVVFAAIAGIQNWWANDHWSSDDNNRFLILCESSGASDSQCGCVLGQLHERYTPQQARQSFYPGSRAIYELAGYCANQ